MRKTRATGGGRGLTKQGAISIRSGELLFSHVFMEEIDDLSALFLDPSKVEFKFGRSVEELVKASEGFTPIA